MSKPVVAAAVVSVFLVCSAGAARADFGPKLIERVRADVRLDGRPVSDQATAALLAPVEEAGEGPANAAKTVPTLMLPYVDHDGNRWNYAEYLWGGDIQNGTVTFKGFMYMPGGLPSVVRLAVYDPPSDRLYVTDVAQPGEYLALMRADLKANGTGTLRSLPIPFWQRMEFWKALLITLLVECGIVLLLVSRQPAAPLGESENRSPSRPRVVRVCVLANLVTLPLVWLFAGEALFLYGFWLGAAAVLALECAAVLVEAVAYRGIRHVRIPWKTAFRASLLANLSTFLLGFVL